MENLEPAAAKVKRRRPTHQPGSFIDPPLLKATEAALRTRCNELKLINNTYRAVLDARKYFGKSIRWVGNLDLDGMLIHMREAVDALNSEKELYLMLTQGHPAVKRAARARIR